MNLLEKIRNDRRDKKFLNKISLDAVRVAVESCDCPKDRLCDVCSDLLEYYKRKKEERRKHLDDACGWLIHQIMTAFYGPGYKEQNFHFNKDIYTLREIVELYDEYLKEKENDGSN